MILFSITLNLSIDNISIADIMLTRIMTPEEQRIAIAEWQFECLGKVVLHDGKLRFWSPSLNRYTDEIDDYHNDLNAMYEAENGLTSDQQDSYAIKLFYICFPRQVYELDCTTHFKTIHATAKQRAEALLRTIGKWT